MADHQAAGCHGPRPRQCRSHDVVAGAWGLQGLSRPPLQCLGVSAAVVTNSRRGPGRPSRQRHAHRVCRAPALCLLLRLRQLRLLL